MPSPRETRRAYLASVTALALAALPQPAAAQTQRPAGLGARSVSLQEMLEKGLRARRPEEFAFLKDVVTLVELGNLPVDLVRSTFDWARYKRPYPFVYFERALKVRAARLGITITTVSSV